MGGTAAGVLSTVVTVYSMVVDDPMPQTCIQGGGEEDGGDDGDADSPMVRSGRGGELHRIRRRRQGWVLILGGTAAGVLSTVVTVYSMFVDDPMPQTCIQGGGEGIN